MTQAEHALETITPYLNRMRPEERDVKRTDVWLEMIPYAEGFDREATAEADPSDTNEIAAFADGSQLWWNHSLKRWEAGP